MTAGIATVYNGTRFRSRLEARYAVLFDQLGWHWEYEPFDCDGYIPDFLIHGRNPLLVEVKPLHDFDEYKAIGVEMQRRTEAQWERDLLVVGVSPWIDDVGGSSVYGAMGLLGEQWADEDGKEDCWWSAGIWHRCFDCNMPAIHHDMSNFAGRPCKHYDGNNLPPLNRREVEQWWAGARNATQWQPGR